MHQTAQKDSRSNGNDTTRRRSTKTFREEMLMPVLVKRRQVDLELLAKSREELDGIVAIHSDVISEAGRRFNARSLYARFFADPGDDSFLKIRH